MKSTPFKTAFLPWVALCVVSLTLPAGSEEWTSIFNGKDLSGWTGVNDVTFDVHEGNLRLVKGMGWLRTDRRYDDFILEFECKAMVENYDSGIFFRAGLEGKPWPDTGFQVNLKHDALGTLVRGYRPLIQSELAGVPAGEWMKFILTSQGEDASLKINGKQVWEADFIEPESGCIGIQAENRSFEFRNFRIQELGYTNLLESEGNELSHLTVHDGPKDAWSLDASGVLVCNGGGGGWIGTKTGDYSDYILKLEYNVPKEGNSGVFIRRPKDGDGAYTGMEIQVIDDDATHWGKLQEWQMTGSIYHEVAPSVRATREAGTWQNMEIVCKKNTISLFINGIQIINANLDDYDTCTTEAKPLKERPRAGYIGFQNYDGHIQYRNVCVKRLAE